MAEDTREEEAQQGYPAGENLRTGVAPWTRSEPRTLIETRVFRVTEHTGESPTTGRSAPFVVVRTVDWVNVIARTAAGEVVMVAQYRHGTDEITLEIPGGMVDPGEEPLAAGLRELREETGYHPAPDATVRVIGTVDPNPAIQDNACATVLVEPVVPGPADPDPHEELAVQLVPGGAVADLIRGRVITHALVVAAFHHLHLDEAPA